VQFVGVSAAGQGTQDFAFLCCKEGDVVRVEERRPAAGVPSSDRKHGLRHVGWQARVKTSRDAHERYDETSRREQLLRVALGFRRTYPSVPLDRSQSLKLRFARSRQGGSSRWQASDRTFDLSRRSDAEPSSLHVCRSTIERKNRRM